MLEQSIELVKANHSADSITSLRRENKMIADDIKNLAKQFEENIYIDEKTGEVFSRNMDYILFTNLPDEVSVKDFLAVQKYEDEFIAETVKRIRESVNNKNKGIEK